MPRPAPMRAPAIRSVSLWIVAPALASATGLPDRDQGLRQPRDVLGVGWKLAQKQEQEIDLRQQSGPRTRGRRGTSLGVGGDISRPHAFEPFERPTDRAAVAGSARKKRSRCRQA